VQIIVIGKGRRALPSFQVVSGSSKQTKQDPFSLFEQPHFDSPLQLVMLSFFKMPDHRASAAAVIRPIRNVVSASWLYPFKGIWYFCAHPEFYPLFGRRLIPLTITSIVVLGLLFTFTYLPQVAFLAIWHGPAAWFNAVFLVLGEGQVAIALLFEALLVDETLVNVFDVRATPHFPGYDPS